LRKDIYFEQLSQDSQHWSCPGCGTLQDREVNAARNLLAYGLAALSGFTVRAGRIWSLWKERLWLGPQDPNETSLGEAGSQLRTCVSRNE